MAPRVWLAEHDEAEIVARLLVEFRDHQGRDWPSANAFLAGVERLMDDQNTEYLLAARHDDAGPSGVCQLRYRYGIWLAATDCWLEDLYIRESDRDAGLGTAILEAAIERARERGCRRIELDVSDANPPALALYRGHGFATGKGGDGTTDVLMRLRLDEAR
jgi:GNAT superfamily N-acetyltransferase